MYMKTLIIIVMNFFFSFKMIKCILVLIILLTYNIISFNIKPLYSKYLNNIDRMTTNILALTFTLIIININNMDSYYYVIIEISKYLIYIINGIYGSYLLILIFYYIS